MRLVKTELHLHEDHSHAVLREGKIVLVLDDRGEIDGLRRIAAQGRTDLWVIADRVEFFR